MNYLMKMFLHIPVILTHQSDPVHTGLTRQFRKVFKERDWMKLLIPCKTKFISLVFINILILNYCIFRSY